MFFYKDSANKVHALDDRDSAHVLPPGCVEITEVEAIALNPPPALASPILEQIAAIEATITPRRMREAALTAAGKTWLAAADTEIAALRAQL